MGKNRRVAMGWSKVASTLAVMLWVVAASVAEDGAKAKKAGKRADAKAPEVVRTEEHEDVNGHSGKPTSARKPKSAATLSPAQIDELILKGLAANNRQSRRRTTRSSSAGSTSTCSAACPEPGLIREFSLPGSGTSQ